MWEWKQLLIVKVLDSMRDLNEDSNSGSWSHFYVDKSDPFLQCKNGYMQSNPADDHEENERDALKQKMLEHDAVLKNQVCELHRLYQIQRTMMGEVQQKDVHSWRPSTETASSSSHQVSQLPFEVTKWNTAASSQWNFANGKTCCSKEDNGASNGRPFKVRKTIDLRLPADGYIDIEEGENIKETSELENGTKTFRFENSGVSANSTRNVSYLRGSTELVDLNAPLKVEDSSAMSFNFLDLTSENTESKSLNQPTEPKVASFGMAGDNLNLSNGYDSKIRYREQLSRTYEQGCSKSTYCSRTQSNHQPERNPLVSHLRNGMSNQDNVHRNLNGYSANLASSHMSPFPFLSSFPSLQASSKLYLGNPSNGFGHFNSHGVMTHGQDRFSRKVYPNSSCRSNQAFQDESKSNGYYHGSREPYFNLPKPGFDCSNISRFNNAASDVTNMPFRRDGKSAVIGFDLNKEVPSSPSDDDVVILEDLNVPMRKFEPSFAWLPKSNPISVSDGKLRLRTEDEVTEIKPVNKIMELSNAEGKSSSCRGKIRMIDINVACNPDEDVFEEDFTGQKVQQINSASSRFCIDLNSCVSDQDDQFASFDETKSSTTRRMIEIDLEAPYVPKETEQVNDISLRDAAELVVTMSSLLPKTPIIENACSLPEALLEQSLLLFAEAIVESETATSKGSSSSSYMDEFEVMTLQLEETEKEHYIPKPIVTELMNMEQRGTSTTNRSRRGQSRRGRPRRDFQRDILPGLTSLSRHEMSEDLQLFGGMMRAMGHCWSSGLTRRNGGNRGRKRAVIESISSHVPTPLIHQLNKMEPGSEERSLTGWGKTTRRPRRQRYPQGNISSVIQIN